MLEAGAQDACIPRATYRLQFHAGFTFQDARALAPYLARLGVSHVYSSPLLRARAGSSHGYDIVDHAALNPELGSAADLDALLAALRAAGLGLILDVVPNHMAVLAADNPWWQDVLQHGRDARHAGYFDIDWQPANPDLHGRVMLPLLGEHYGACLHAGELRLALDVPRGAFELHYYEHCLPLSPASHAALCAAAAARCAPTSPSRVALTGLAAQFEAGAPGAQDALVLGQRAFAAVLAREPQVHAALDAVLGAWNGVVGEPASFDALHA
ncbi:MAG: alpha-amylase family glycosyl hydrolase, partial [Gammaproteobacteria bacterium]